MYLYKCSLHFSCHQECGVTSAMPPPRVYMLYVYFQSNVKHFYLFPCEAYMCFLDSMFMCHVSCGSDVRTAIFSFILQTQFTFGYQ